MAKDKAVKKRRLPPDPERQNAMRANCAKRALEAFQADTGTDNEDALSDLLCDLIHMCDRSKKYEAFDAALDRAKRHYEVETMPVKRYAEWWNKPVEAK